MTKEQFDNELEQNLTRMAESTGQLESVLNLLFEALAARGIQPSPHIQQALDSVRLYLDNARTAGRQMNNQLTHLRELVRTSALITSSLELDQVVEEVLDTITSLTGAERTYLMLYDETNDLKTVSARNWERESLDESEIVFSRSIIDAALKDKAPIITTNAQNDERFGGQKSIVFQKLRSILCIPLMLGGHTVGVLYSDNRFQQDLFDRSFVPVLTAFGTQAAIAIKNAQAFGEVKEDLKEAQRVIMRLQIEIDRGRVDEEVQRITDTDYFRDLADMAASLREKYEKKRRSK